jgi:flagellar FliL protein
METGLNRILTIILIVLASFILCVTGISFAVKKAAPGKNIRTADPDPGQVANLSTPDNTKLAAYTGLGRLRTVTKPDARRKDDIGTPVVITPWFTYADGDTVFYEEMARKSAMMQSIITQYFTQYTESELRRAGEEKIKADLLEQLNARFSLGKIRSVYFSDYIFLE